MISSCLHIVQDLEPSGIPNKTQEQYKKLIDCHER